MQTRTVMLMIAGTLGVTGCGKKGAPPAPVTASSEAHSHPPGTPPHDDGPDVARGSDPHRDHDAHAHEAGRHGGIVKSAGSYHLEVAVSKAGFMVFPLDAKEADLPLAGITGKVLVATKDGKPPVEAALEPMGSHLFAAVAPAGPWTAVVTLTVHGNSVSARFEGAGVTAKGGGDAGEHDHAHGAAEAVKWTCPMHPEIVKDAPGACPICGMALTKTAPDKMAMAGHAHGSMAMPEMALSDKVDAHVEQVGPVAAGQPGTLTFAFHRKEPHGAITDFEVAHEKKLHVFVVSEDLSFFAHVHPELVDAAKGAWRLVQTFPAPGRYRVYADFKSISAGPVVTMSVFDVVGAQPETKPLVVDTAATATKSFGDLSVTLTTSPSPVAAGDVTLSYLIKDAAGQDVTDLEPYLGAFGHLFILNEDRVTMAHAHPEDAAASADLRGGPTVAFHAKLSKAGRYKLWAEFKRSGAVVTTDWVVQVP